MSYVYGLNLTFFCGICNTCLMYFVFSLFRTKKQGKIVHYFSLLSAFLFHSNDFRHFTLLLFFLLFRLDLRLIGRPTFQKLLPVIRQMHHHGTPRPGGIMICDGFRDGPVGRDRLCPQ